MFYADHVIVSFEHRPIRTTTTNAKNRCSFFRVPPHACRMMYLVLDSVVWWSDCINVSKHKNQQYAAITEYSWALCVSCLSIYILQLMQWAGANWWHSAKAPLSPWCVIYSEWDTPSIAHDDYTTIVNARYALVVTWRRRKSVWRKSDADGRRRGLPIDLMGFRCVCLPFGHNNRFYIESMHSINHRPTNPTKWFDTRAPQTPKR